MIARSFILTVGIGPDIVGHALQTSPCTERIPHIFLTEPPVAKTKSVILTCLICVASVVHTTAQAFKTVATFNGANGGAPLYSAPVQGTDGNLYGVGSFGDGSIFKLDRAGNLSSIFTFDGANGAESFGGLILANGGRFYGTTRGGGTYGAGTVFSTTNSGTFTSLYSFCATSGCPDGDGPEGPLIQAWDGNLYGTAASGGLNVCVNSGSCGLIFKMTPAGAVTVFYLFCQESNCTDGFAPFGGLVQGADGTLYGTTNAGGLGFGTVFKITTAGQFTTLYTFCSQTDCPDGRNPLAGLTLGLDGNFYGSTALGGNNSLCSNGCGTLFKITPQGALTTLYSFSSIDGNQPSGTLAQGSDGNFYGTTRFGGTSFLCQGGCGTVFQLTPQGTLTTLHSFHNNGDGDYPLGGVFQATDGKFYGMTFTGGSSDLGTVFRLDMGLGPFVTLVRKAGKVGQTVGILGYGLQNASAVSFNGTPSKFTIRSGTYIAAIVPAGVTTGVVTVTTSSGTLSSNIAFQVLP